MVERLEIDLDDVYIKDYKETKVIAIINNRGKCGRSSSVIGLSYSLSELGHKVLIIDADMQFHVSSSFKQKINKERNLNTAILQETTNLHEYILNTKYENIDIIISDFKLAVIEQNLFTKMLRESIFKVMLDPLIKKGIYDFIIIDTNPTLGLLNLNILNASNYVIVPVSLIDNGFRGLEVVLGFIEEVGKLNPGLKLLGVLKNKVDPEDDEVKEVDEILNRIYTGAIFKTEICIDANFKESQYDMDPLTFSTRVREQYLDLANEIISLVK